MERPRVCVIVPALNEEASIGKVLGAIPRRLVDRVVVVDNGSTDRTAAVAEAAGATVVREPRRGYGQACLAGLAHTGEAEVILFMDADASDDPPDASRILAPIFAGCADMVIGSRTRGRRETGALPLHAAFGNYLSAFLILLLWGKRYSDLGPFRAVRSSALRALRMRDQDYGWTVEMQVKAARLGLKVVEVPVSYRRRIGRSKISGTIKGSVSAGWKILVTIFRHAVLP